MAETTEQYKARIAQIKNSIKNEPHIKKMRDDIAEGISKTGNRQADIEDQFKDVIEGTTGKDVISAPEIIAARKGEASLNARLTRNEQETTAQIQQTKIDLAQTNWKKADVNYVDQQISTMTNGAIKGTYTTYEALKTAHENGATGPFLVEEDGDRYIWDVDKLKWKSIGPYEPAEISDGGITTEKIANEAIIPSKTTFFRYSENIEIGELKPNTYLQNGVEVSTTSTITGFSTTLYILVKPNTTYYASETEYSNFYNKKGIATIGPIGKNNHVFTTPENANYVRFSIKDVDNFEFYEMDEFGGRKAYFKEDIHLKENQITPLEADFLIPNSKELYNPEENIPGYYINNGQLSANTASNSGFTVTGYMPVIAGKKYYAPETEWSGYYTQKNDSGFISYIGSENHEFTTPPNANFVRFSIKDVDRFSFIENMYELDRKQILNTSSQEIDSEVYADTADYSKLKALESLENMRAGKLTFALPEDSHYASDGSSDSDSYGLVSLRDVCEVSKKIGLDFICVNGDIHQGFSPKEDTQKDLLDVVQMFNENAASDFFFSEGNHDDNSKYDMENGNELKHVLDHDDWFNIMIKPSLKFGIKIDEDNKNGGYFYKDYPNCKMRVIVLNSMDVPYDLNDSGKAKVDHHSVYAISQEQLTWFGEKALNFDDKVGDSQEWGIVVISHVPLLASQNTYGSYKDAEGILELMKGFKQGIAVDYNGDANISMNFTEPHYHVVSFAGHVHKDTVQVSNGVPYITSNCVKSLGRDPIKSETKNSFDVITVDKNEKKVYLKRYGVGADRVVSY